PVAFVDDDVAKLQMEIYGVPVLGQIKDIPTLVENHHIERVVIAIPSLRNGQLNNIVSKCNETKAKVQMIPKIEDLMTGKDRKSTRLNSSHVSISYAVCCLKKKKNIKLVNEYI